MVEGKIYLIGGILFENRRGPFGLSIVETYDPATDMWRKRSKMSIQRDNFRVGIINNRIYAIGESGWPQFGNGGPFLRTIEEYTPKVEHWRKRVDMPELRLSFATVVVDNIIYLIGGFIWQGGDTTYLASVDVYIPETENLIYTAYYLTGLTQIRQISDI